MSRQFNDDDGLSHLDQLYDERSTYDSYLETISELERDVRKAAHVTVELLDGGPLREYLIEVRADAVEALMEMVRTDPKDTVLMTTLQSRVRQFAELSQFITARLEAGKQAESYIKENYSNERR